jgi:hypothetical protein
MNGLGILEFGVRPVMSTSICLLAIFVLLFGPLVFAQNQEPSAAEKESTPVGKGVDYLLNYLNMAGTMKASDFRPLTQRERSSLYLKTMVNPVGYIKVGFSAGIDHWKDKPPEWEQGASGYGKRFANILGQYSIQRTVTFGLSSALHEDNRISIPARRASGPGLHMRCQAACLRVMTMEGGMCRSPNWAEWPRVLSYPALGSRQVSTLLEMGLSASASAWRAAWGSA